ncbi:hypothetical protein QBC35DRAFT_478707 [Podospora australis]|uniref:C2H2-type domain-containing protein n=1 Tax=Podospora australis TaxID=1536484 RepID=A0AAN6WJ43_9PEZI|nr:hypothetical protein QBC35DRAFT_478707 [Podospora australis]
MLTGNEFSRFKVWAGNIGAHRSGRSSLDYRLRDASNIRAQVINLLEDLAESLNDGSEIHRGDRTPWDQEPPGSPSPDNSDDDDDLMGAPAGLTELTQISADITEVINCLFRLSVSIQNPAPHDKFKQKNWVDTSFFEQSDIAHVGNMFPTATDQACQRLGKAISRRRQYFKYRELHHHKLARGLEMDLESGNKDDDDAAQSTVASSIPRHLKSTSGAPPISEGPQVLDEDTFSVSGWTDNTFAASVVGAEERRKIPALPKGAEDHPFECPFCYMMISATNTRAWKKHVLADLRPYICLSPDCSMCNADFQGRHQWMQHVLQNHWKTWSCAHCTDTLESATEMRRHLVDCHSNSVRLEQVDDMVDRNEKSKPLTSASKCPLCHQQLNSAKEYARHVGGHQRDLALFALPRIEGEDDMDEPLSDITNNEDDVSSLGQESFIDDTHQLPTNEHMAPAVNDAHSRPIALTSGIPPSLPPDSASSSDVELQGEYSGPPLPPYPTYPTFEKQVKCLCGHDQNKGTGTLLHCKICDTWQHLACYYPYNADQVTHPDFLHRCADCQSIPSDGLHPKLATTINARRISLTPFSRLAVSEPGPFFCSFQDCRQSFRLEDDFHDHLKSHGNLFQKGRWCRIGVCRSSPPGGKWFRKKRQLWDHMVEEHDYVVTDDENNSDDDESEVDIRVLPDSNQSDAPSNHLVPSQRASQQGTEGDKVIENFGIPQFTPDGWPFNLNTMTGETTMESPLEPSSSITETTADAERETHHDDVRERGSKASTSMIQDFTLEESSAQDKVEKSPKGLLEEGQEMAQHTTGEKKKPPPVRFKDAVGRKFSLPWHICRTWKSMEEVIQQAFLHVEAISAQVQRGEYNLTGSDGEVISPERWGAVIQPGMEITMHMWPSSPRYTSSGTLATAPWPPQFIPRESPLEGDGSKDASRSPTHFISPAFRDPEHGPGSTGWRNQRTSFSRKRMREPSNDGGQCLGVNSHEERELEEAKRELQEAKRRLERLKALEKLHSDSFAEQQRDPASGTADAEEERQRHRWEEGWELERAKEELQELKANFLATQDADARAKDMADIAEQELWRRWKMDRDYDSIKKKIEKKKEIEKMKPRINAGAVADDNAGSSVQELEHDSQETIRLEDLRRLVQDRKTNEPDPEKRRLQEEFELKEAEKELQKLKESYAESENDTKQRDAMTDELVDGSGKRSRRSPHDDPRDCRVIGCRKKHAYAKDTTGRKIYADYCAQHLCEKTFPLSEGLHCPNPKKENDQYCSKHMNAVSQTATRLATSPHTTGHNSIALDTGAREMQQSTSKDQERNKEGKEQEQNIARPGYTRFSLRHLDIETLQYYKIDWEWDAEPGYILVKRWIPESEQHMLWEHTRQIRTIEPRSNDKKLAMSTSQLASQVHRSADPNCKQAEEEAIPRWKAKEANRITAEEAATQAYAEEFQRRLRVELSDAGLSGKEIEAILKKEGIKQKERRAHEEKKDENQGAPPTYTRLSLRHLDVATLQFYKMDWERDAEPGYILIKRWVPEWEQNMLWEHTRKLRLDEKTKQEKVAESRDKLDLSMKPSTRHDTDWSSVSDPAERRRIANRQAKRSFQKRRKEYLQELESRAGSSNNPPPTSPDSPEIRSIDPEISLEQHVQEPEQLAQSEQPTDRGETLVTAAQPLQILD